MTIWNIIDRDYIRFDFCCVQWAPATFDWSHSIPVGGTTHVQVIRILYTPSRPQLLHLRHFSSTPCLLACLKQIAHIESTCLVTCFEGAAAGAWSTADFLLVGGVSVRGISDRPTGSIAPSGGWKNKESEVNIIIKNIGSRYLNKGNYNPAGYKIFVKIFAQTARNTNSMSQTQEM